MHAAEFEVLEVDEVSDKGFKTFDSLPAFLKDTRNMLPNLSCGFLHFYLIFLAVPHRASQIARCASQFRIAGPKSQETCHAVSNASHASLLKSPHRRHFAVETPHRREKWSPKLYKFHRNLKNSCKNVDKLKFGRSPWHETVFHISPVKIISNLSDKLPNIF